MADDEDAAKETVANSSPAEPQTPKTSLQQHARSTTSAQVSVSPQNQGATPKQRSSSVSALPPGVIPLPPGSRGPRSLYLRRQENGFGFTLRHFIVYPPEPLDDDGSGGFPTQPMDTIFVKRVVEGGAGALAGLRQGDRIVSVNGQTINGLTYAQVVGLIKRSPQYLHLLVVPQQDDVLQKYFCETAHNPETNRRPSIQEPNILHHNPNVFNKAAMIPQPPTVVNPHLARTAPHGQLQEVNMHTAHAAAAAPSMTDSNYYQPIENIYNMPHDGIFNTANRSRNSLSQEQQRAFHNIYAEPYHQNLHQRSRAQPQAPLMRPTAQPQVPTSARPCLRRHSVRRLSEGSSISDSSKETRSYESGDYCSINSERLSVNSGDNILVNNGNQIQRNSSKNVNINTFPFSSNISGGKDPLINNIFYPNKSGCRLSLDAGRRDSMNSSTADGSKDSLSSFGSSSTLTGQDTDDSVIMSRLRKNFEKKEAFLKRPSKPTGFLETTDNVKSSSNPMVIQREFYGRPQKLQKPVWPPNRQSSSKPLHQDFERIKSDLNIEKDFIKDQEKHSSRDKYDLDQCYMSDSETQYQSDGLKMSLNPIQKSSSQREKGAFASTLSRIHENIPSTVTNFGADDSNGTSSNSSDCQLSENSGHYPAVVWKRTRQFESGKTIPDDENGSISDRTSLYSSELARLSSKRVVPNVAVRKREFETRTEELNKELQRERESLRRLTNKESRSLEYAGKNKMSTNTLKGNMAIPIGSKYLHCPPPSDYKSTPDSDFEGDAPPTRFRARSNSTGSWNYSKNDDTFSGGVGGRVRVTLDWRTTHNNMSEEEKQRHKAVRQDSYLAAVRGPSVKSTDCQNQGTPKETVLNETEEIASPASNTNNSPQSSSPNNIQSPNKSNIKITVTPTTMKTAVRPTHLPISEPLGQCFKDSETILHIDDVTPDSPDLTMPSVIRRTNLSAIGDEERATRRVSYLKATLGDRMLMDSDIDVSDTEDLPRPQALRSSSPKSGNSPSPTAIDKENHCPIIKEGSLYCKVTLQDRKRATDRSWKQVWAVLNKGSQLLLYNYRNHQSPMGLADMNADLITPSLDVRYSVVEVADDYTKRKNVLRVSSVAGAEILLQADNTSEMLHWVRALQQQATNETEEEATIASKQQAVPQQVPAGTSVQVQGATRLSPLPGHKSIRKLTSFRNRSPTGQSPVNKTRKSSQAVENLPSPKSKTWGRVVKQFRKIHHSAGSPSSPTGPEGATIGIPIELCPPSMFSEFVPLIVEICTRIVEERGLDVIGIYRVPGNTAAITLLTDEVNKGFTSSTLQDPRWNDVNVVSSLLKSFFRRLPDSLFTTSLYPKFIEADKIDNNNRRLLMIRKLLNDLPDHHYETLKYLMLHLKRIVEHSEVNKMEARNLAIVFGPTLVRAGDDNMVTMVTDMQHQCRIIESLLCHVDWFFCEDDADNFSLPPLNDKSSLDTESTTSVANHNLLLNNIDKIEGMKSSSTGKEVAKVIKSTIISAAHRKIQRGNKLPSQSRNHSKINYLEDAKNENDHDSTNGEIVDNESIQQNEIEHHDAIPTTVIDFERKSPNNSTSSITSSSSSSKYRPIVNITNGTIRSYAGLSATTQERIRKFEQETRAMLAKRRLEEDKRRNEMEWANDSKLSLSNEQLPTSNKTDTSPYTKTENMASNKYLPISKNASTSNVLNNTHYLNKHDDSNTYKICADGNTYLRYGANDIDPRSRCSLPIGQGSAEQVSNRSVLRRGSSVENVNFNELMQDRNVNSSNNGTLKRLKTGRESSQVTSSISGGSYNVPLQQRCGSLDSLDRMHNDLRRSTDLSDDGSDLLTSLTTTFDKKLRSLLNTSSSPLVVDENIPYFDESPDKLYPSDENIPMKTFTLAEPPFKLFRNPSLHKNAVEKLEKQDSTQSISPKLQKEVVEKEKDEDSKEGISADNESMPDNDRFVQNQILANKIEKEFEPSKIKLKRSESLNKADMKVKVSTANGKLKRSESLNRSSDKNEKLHRVDSLTKNEKTECNISKKRELGSSNHRKSFSTKLKRKNGMPERSIKRRHTVGGTKDFDKVHWLDNRLHNQTNCDQSTHKDEFNNQYCCKEKPLRTSSPDLTRRDRFLLEVNLLGPEGMIVALRKHLVGPRPHSLPETRVYKVPLESHV
ncbi:uncharacterized protein LOC123296735 isoform X2 [Chrysoperla carnea]|uniref:uncharacterized protein LOC123296735 isoform X2 n=1 Tax=Chrysoperla carnea TaxID=189513 RepID=UPI001D078698|nr:uncharacterized protein LOC123296735 isoform X2 [Chrysoperla carnea]